MRHFLWIGISIVLCPGFFIATTAFDADQKAIIRTVAGDGRDQDSGPSGRAIEMSFGQPFGVEIGPDGRLYATGVSHHRVHCIDLKSGQLTTVAGNGTKGYSGDGSPATEAQLNEPYEVRFDSSGNMLFVEMQNHVIRRVDARTGVITTVAGTGVPGDAGDGGPATAAQFRRPHSIALDSDDNIFVADIGNHRIRRIDSKTAIVTTVAGTGAKQLPTDGGPAAGTPVLGPRALYIAGPTLWVALREGNSIWKLDLDTGLWHHVAGTGAKGFTGDGGDPKQATFNGPKGIVATPDGTVYVVDTENQAIRRINTNRGSIQTIAGVGPDGRGFKGENSDSRAAHLDRPHGICLWRDSAGKTVVIIGDTVNHRIRAIHLP